MALRNLFLRSAKTAAIATLTTTAALMLASKRETGSPWAAINAVSHVFDGDDRDFPKGFAPRETAIGFGFSATAMASWSVMYEYLFGGVPFPSSTLWAALATAGVWAIDYRLLPKRMTPGFEKHLSPKAVAAVYGVLAATFALAPLWNRPCGMSNAGSGEPR